MLSAPDIDARPFFINGRTYTVSIPLNRSMQD
jgi:hypothetical protein